MSFYVFLLLEILVCSISASSLLKKALPFLEAVETKTSEGRIIRKLYESILENLDHEDKYLKNILEDEPSEENIERFTQEMFRIANDRARTAVDVPQNDRGIMDWWTKLKYWLQNVLIDLIKQSGKAAALELVKLALLPSLGPYLETVLNFVEDIYKTYF